MTDSTPEWDEEDFSDVVTSEPDDVPRFLPEREEVHDEPDMFRGFISPSQRNTAEALAWYRQAANNPPFDPDGMCLKICRSARNIGSMYPSAKKAQDATPKTHRVYKLEDVRPGMVMYFDTVGDSNPYGHIVTVSIANNARSLSDIVVWTNSVRANKIVRVNADYFGRYWGDKYQFAATWLNGQELILAKPQQPKPQPKKEWDEMATKEEVKDAFREVLQEKLVSVPDNEDSNAFDLKGKVSFLTAVQGAWRNSRAANVTLKRSK